MKPNLLFLVEVDLPSGTQPTPELAEEVARLLRSAVGNVAAPPVAIGAVVQPVIASWDYRCTERREHLATDLGARGGTGGTIRFGRRRSSGSRGPLMSVSTTAP